MLPGTRAVGIDPAPKICYPLDPTTTVFEETSDAFFEKHDLRVELGGKPVDAAFIDGMHLFEFALRDFVNLERHAHPDAVILIHDCYPGTEAWTSRDERSTRIWAGDVWKLIVCLRETRPDLRVAAVDVPPTGLGVVCGLDPASSVLSDRYEEIVGRFRDMRYAMLAADMAGTLNRVDDDWNVVRELLPAPFREADAARLVRERRRRRRTAAVASRYMRHRVATSELGRPLVRVRDRLRGS